MEYKIGPARHLTAFVLLLVVLISCAGKMSVEEARQVTVSMSGRTELADNLMRQNRLLEAEQECRLAIKAFIAQAGHERSGQRENCGQLCPPFFLGTVYHCRRKPQVKPPRGKPRGILIRMAELSVAFSPPSLTSVAIAMEVKKLRRALLAIHPHGKPWGFLAKESKAAGSSSATADSSGLLHPNKAILIKATNAFYSDLIDKTNEL